MFEDLSVQQCGLSQTSNGTVLVVIMNDHRMWSVMSVEHAAADISDTVLVPVIEASDDELVETMKSLSHAQQQPRNHSIWQNHNFKDQTALLLFCVGLISVQLVS